MAEPNDPYVWWCGGRLEVVREDPYVAIPSDEAPDLQHHTNGFAVVANAYMVCSGCDRAAPFANGCRWVSRTEGRRLQEDGDA